MCRAMNHVTDGVALIRLGTPKHMKIVEIIYPVSTTFTSSLNRSAPKNILKKSCFIVFFGFIYKIIYFSTS